MLLCPSAVYAACPVLLVCEVSIPSVSPQREKKPELPKHDPSHPRGRWRSVPKGNNLRVYSMHPGGGIEEGGSLRGAYPQASA